jgi:tRNA pseudouridine13 synthase
VSQRIRKYGLKPIVGDLVFKDNDAKEALIEIIDEEEIKEENNDLSNGKCPEVEIISEESLSKYTIFDVVYPLPGCDVRYPENEIGKWYIDLLAKDNLTSEKLMKKNKYVLFFKNAIT